jgi:hypothetical protein
MTVDAKKPYFAGLFAIGPDATSGGRGAAFWLGPYARHAESREPEPFEMPPPPAMPHGSKRLCDRGCYARAAAMPIHAATPAMLQSPLSKHGPHLELSMPRSAAASLAAAAQLRLSKPLGYDAFPARCGLAEG